MGGATAPLWITVALAILTVIGTVTGAWGGQWIATRRDDKRWEREAAREDLRWQRERQRIADEHARDLAKHWMTTRLEALSELNGVLHSFEETLWHAINAVGEDERPGPDVISRMKAYVDELKPLTAKLDLVASKRLGERAADLIHLFEGCVVQLEYGQRVLPGETSPQSSVAEAYHYFVDDMREELGQDPFSSTTSTPSPPSATTS